MVPGSELHVVVGATGGTGRAIVHELVARGKRVRAVNRGGNGRFPSGVEVAAGDATDAARMREVCRGATVVYNCINPPFGRWTELFPAAVQGTIVGAAEAGAKLVFADDTWMYGKVDGPMTEELPSRPVCNRGVLRAWLSEMVLAAHCRGTVRATIGRAPELYGPAVESVLGRNLFPPALAGRRAWWIGNLDVPLTPIFIEDFARGLVELGERDEALGEVWHIPPGEPITGREFVRTIFEEAGRTPKIGRIGHNAVRALGLVVPVARDGAELVYQFEAPFIVDASKFRRAFGDAAEPTPNREGIRRTLEWYRSRDRT